MVKTPGADRSPLAEGLKKHGVGEPTISTRRKPFTVMNADEVKRLR